MCEKIGSNKHQTRRHTAVLVSRKFQRHAWRLCQHDFFLYLYPSLYLCSFSFLRFDTMWLMSCWLVTIDLNKNVSYFLFANRFVDWCVRSLIRTAVIWITDRTIQPNERNELVCFLHSDTNRISYSVQRQFAIECYSFLGICSLCLFSIHTEMCLFAVNECIETSGFEWKNKKNDFLCLRFFPSTTTTPHSAVECAKTVFDMHRFSLQSRLARTISNVQRPHGQLFFFIFIHL